MGMDVKLVACFFIVWSVGSVAQHTSTPSETPFPECDGERVEEKCGGALRRCKDVQVSLTARHIADNLLCVANDVSTTYRLRGCPIGYYDQNTAGVCRITNGSNGTDLLLTSDDLEPGLHSFDCVVDRSDQSASTYVVVANDSSPYRIVQVNINGVLQDRNGSTNFDLYVGDNITVFVLAVGNVSLINASNEERFICATHFPCNAQSSEVADRYLECSLRTPANMSDDGRVLRILLDKMELTTITISMNESPLADPQTTSAATTTTITTTPTAATTTTTTATTAAPATNTTATPTTMTTGTNTTTSSAAAVPNPTVTQMPAITPSVTTTSIIIASVIPSVHVSHTATDDNATPTSSATDKAPHGNSSGVAIAVITGSLFSCIVLFGVSFVYYCKCRKTRVSKKSIEATPPSLPHKVLSFSCPHCDELDKDIKASGYAIQKLPKNQFNDSYKKECKVLSDENVPVIVCGNPECQAQHWLESSRMPENWRNILQLRVAGDGDETPVQPNQRVKVISCAGPDDRAPVKEVLHWLNNVSQRGSITSIDERELKLNEIHQDVNKLHKLVVQRADEISEKQDQTNTGIDMLHIDAQYERQE